MFTGIITHIGVINKIEFNDKKDCLLAILVERKIARKLDIGCSIACNGICLTLIKQEKFLSKTKSATQLFFQASKETLSSTNLGEWHIGKKINLEFALRLGDELGGHIVSGHIDGCAKLINKKHIRDSVQMEFQLEKKSIALKKFIAPKGSICLNGVSLTINNAINNKFFVNLIQHSLLNTSFNAIKIDDLVNVEIDLIARYVLANSRAIKTAKIKQKND